MSTLMSRDLNIERSSTRLHAPPGGKSSISFGDDTSSSSSYPTKRNTPQTQYSQQYQQQQNQQQTASYGKSTPKNTQVSMSDLLSQNHNSSYDNEEEERKKRNQQRGSTNSSQMTAAMNHENVMPKTSTRVRQAPGGRSTIVIG
eukprot:CAMPEP_0174818572 /NCGR_PEP_ID=MMETSP1107-20130205/1307_1 /TAXON_ID=36770 /ORGANISM="Paraphysomonas vestita, Strain GFlagA" /LENGTH=143 /DNA_ID=CAMNT_0016030599 /DNA_START=55 /DNA_END=486 /DNA_ORIENTATION=+